MQPSKEITPAQKREYLIILLRDGNDAAQIYLDEVTPKGNWLLTLPDETQDEVLRFVNIVGLGLEQNNIIFECAKYTGDALIKCFDEGREKILNTVSK